MISWAATSRQTASLCLPVHRARDRAPRTASRSTASRRLRIDALGIAGMFRTDVVIGSSCRACASRIEIGTAQGGKSLSYVRPGDAVIWYDLAYSVRAAAPCCPSIAFFCSKAELQQWLSPQSRPRAGYRLTLDEALEVGRALFEPVLATGSPLRPPRSNGERCADEFSQSQMPALMLGAGQLLRRCIL
jgi:hypothetical protein